MNLTRDQAALLARVLADPADDTPRLLLADAFAEAGDEDRGEFIRCQVRLAEMQESGADARRDPEAFQAEYEALCRREGELLDVAAAEDWAALPAAWVDEWWWSRGFVSKVQAPWPAWRDHGDAVRRAHPVERVVLTTRPGITFSRIRYRDHHNPKMRVWERDATWEVNVGFAEPMTFGNRCAWSDRDRLVGGAAAITLIQDNFDRENADARTVAGFLRRRWPRTPDLGPVEFELPPEPDWANFTTRYRDWANEGR